MTASKYAIMGQGLPPEVPWVIFPYALYLSDSDVAGIVGPKLDEIMAGLTTWKAEGTYTSGQIITRAPVKVTGKSYPDAYKNLQYTMLSKNWSDGWPVNPGNKEAIDWMMTGVPTGKKLSDPIGGGSGKVYPKCGILTYEVLATCMAMAGGRPEYMPIAVAACETIIAKENTTLSSSMSAYPITMVNGPVAKQIRLSSGFGLFGPDPNYPAGSAIKRAIWLVHQGCGGLVSGGGTIAQYGYMRPGICFAENEEFMPASWKTYTEERFQRSRGTNSVTYGLSSGGAIRDFTHRGNGAEPSHQIELSESFDRFASQVKNIPSSGVPGDAQGSTMMWLINAAIAGDLLANGYDKEQIKKTAAERLWYLLGEVIDRSGIQRSIEQKKADVGTDMLKKIKLCTDPQRIHVVCAGGDHPSRSCVIPSWGAQGNVEIVLPSNWDQLLADADRDLGPLPA
jgi:hypothetical protein